jgi:hypothetical protein
MSERGFRQNTREFVGNDIRLGIDAAEVVSCIGVEKECGLEAGEVVPRCARGATLGQPGLSRTVVTLEEVDGMWVATPQQ